LQYAGIDGEVRFLAMVDRIEIWSKQALEELMAQSGGLGELMEEQFGQ
jgi:DNA-binding transcriptional regulator/RsmH inhibitor MraZ